MLCSVLSSYLSDTPRNGRLSDRQRFNNAVSEIEACDHDGSIPNVLYKGAKDIFNHALDKAYEQIRHEQYAACRYRDLPVTVQKFADLFGIVYLHAVPGLIKRAEKLKMDGQEHHPFRTQMLILLYDVKVLAEIMTDLKDKVVKRQPKPVEEQKVGYHPPKVSTKAEAKVVALLEEVTTKSYEDLKIRLMHHFHNGHRLFLEALADDAKLTPYDYFVKNRQYTPDHTLANVIEKVRDYNASSRTYVSMSMDLVAVTFGNIAIKTADEIRTHFVHKNFRKIASIIEGKGDTYLNGTAVESTVDLNGLEGTFYFTFSDESCFTVVNKVVLSYSVYGKPFNRFPLTFHDVRLPGNKKMARPSEERMNKVFLNKEMK